MAFIKVLSVRATMLGHDEEERAQQGPPNEVSAQRGKVAAATPLWGGGAPARRFFQTQIATAHTMGTHQHYIIYVVCQVFHFPAATGDNREATS